MVVFVVFFEVFFEVPILFLLLLIQPLNKGFLGLAILGFLGGDKQTDIVTDIPVLYGIYNTFLDKIFVSKISTKCLVSKVLCLEIF